MKKCCHRFSAKETNTFVRKKKINSILRVEFRVNANFSFLDFEKKKNQKRAPKIQCHGSALEGHPLL